jgi:hypothetical protein
MAINPAFSRAIASVKTHKRAGPITVGNAGKALEPAF